MVPAFATRAFPDHPKVSSNSTFTIDSADLIVEAELNKLAGTTDDIQVTRSIAGGQTTLTIYYEGAGIASVPAGFDIEEPSVLQVSSTGAWASSGRTRAG